jgi:glycosyltransferase involved in cell wall biosynthesis
MTESLKVLHINQSDIAGGAAIAAYRLHQGLLLENVGSKLLVGTAGTNSSLVELVPRKPAIENRINHINSRLGLNYINLISSFEIPNHPFFQEADILNFHNLHTGYFNYLAIPELTKHKPAVFTLHDMWSFTGHCAYSYNCDRWQTGCGNCPYPDTYPAIQRDNTRLEWNLKNWVYERSNLTIVAPSQWLVRQAQHSVLNRFAIHHIPYGIDTQIYQPLEPELCRSLLGIAPNKKVLMFGAESLKDPRKGGDLLLKILQQLPDSLRQELVLLTMGHGGEKIESTVNIETINLGYIGGDRLKVIAYSAAVLFLFPTRADNLPLVVQESLACGVPVVTFKVGGVSDMVRPGVTGYLAQPEDTQDFCQGIVELLEGGQEGDRLRQRCREVAVTEYPLELQAQRYLELYQQILHSTRS